jgi:hypothetical protein
MASKTASKPPVDPPGDDEHVDPKTGEIVTAAKPGALATVDEAELYGADAGAGFENQTSEDYSIPWVRVLHTQSPEVIKDSESETPRFRGGMIYNSVRQTLYKGSTGMTFIPVTTHHHFVEFVPRKQGGGFVGQYELDDPFVQKIRKEQKLGDYKNPANGNDVSEVFNLYFLELDEEGTPAPAVFGFSSTMIRPYRDFMTRARNLAVVLADGRKISNLPLFSHGYKMTTVKMEKNENVWWVPELTFAGENAAASRLPPASELYLKARDLATSIAAGRVRADVSKMSQEGAAMDAAPRRGSTDAEGAPY